MTATVDRSRLITAFVSVAGILILFQNFYLLNILKLQLFLFVQFLGLAGAWWGHEFKKRSVFFTCASAAVLTSVYGVIKTGELFPGSPLWAAALFGVIILPVPQPVQTPLTNSQRFFFVYLVVLLGKIGFTGNWFIAMRPPFGLCPPWFQDCGAFQWFSHPESSGYLMFRIAFASLILFALKCAQSGRWEAARGCAALFSVFYLILVYLSSFHPVPGYEWYFFFPGLMYLFGGRESSAAIALVFLYVWSGLNKLSESWIAGEVILSLFGHKLPYVLQELAPVLSNLTIFCQLSLSVSLFSEKNSLRRTAIVCLSLFHLGTYLFVGPKFALFCVPMLTYFFWERAPKLEFGPALVSGLLIYSAINIHQFTRGERAIYTHEGQGLAIDMFAHARFGKSEIFSGSRLVSRGNNYADPFLTIYREWGRIQRMCAEAPGTPLRWRFTISRNGRPEWPVVETENACGLRYNFWQANAWLKAPDEDEAAKLLPLYRRPFLDAFFRRYQTVMVAAHLLAAFLMFWFIGYRRYKNAKVAVP